MEDFKSRRLVVCVRPYVEGTGDLIDQRVLSTEPKGEGIQDGVRAAEVNAHSGNEHRVGNTHPRKIC